MTARSKVYFAWTLILFAVVGWPTSAFTVAKSEPQVVLGLSWIAILLTGVTALFEAQVLVKQEEENET